MPRRRRTAARQLSPRQKWELIGLGWNGICRSPEHRRAGTCDGIGCWSAFASDDEREAAYWAHRDKLISGRSPGVRPAAFWKYEAPTVCRHSPPCLVPALFGSADEHTAWLELHGLLSPQEAAALRRAEEKRAAIQSGAPLLCIVSDPDPEEV